MDHNSLHITPELQETFLLSISSNFVSGVTICEDDPCDAEAPKSVKELEELLETIIVEDLSKNQLDHWQIVWGPTIYQAPLSKIADNTMVVFKHQDHPKFVVSIAGTNSTKEYRLDSFGWQIEDFFIGEQVPWWFGNPSEQGLEPKIAAGTLVGFLLLKNMKKERNLSGFATGDDLETFFREQVQNTNAEVEITLAGHSLGGTLSPVVALWLSDIHDAWGGNVTIKCVPSAGLTAGNPDFAQYFDSQLGHNTTRIYNNLDITPYSWHDIDYLVDIYDGSDYELPPGRKVAVKGLVAQMRDGNDYSQITQSQPPLQGEIQELTDPPEDDVLRYLAQTGYQHIKAYFDLLGLEQPEGLQLDYMATKMAPLFHRAELNSLSLN